MNEDRTLLDAFLATRDEGAFRALYDRRTPALYGLALRLAGGVESDAVEIVQETWVRAVRALDRFQWRSSLSTWLGGIAVNCHRELLRGRARTFEELPEQIAAPTDAVIHTVTRIALKEAISALPAGYREMVVLYDIEGYTHTEISKMLGVAEGTCKSQLSRARKALRAALADQTRAGSAQE